MRFLDWVNRIFKYTNQEQDKRLFAQLSDEEVITKYIDAGAAFGDAVGFIYNDECANFREMFEEWEKWEREYVKRGFRSIPLDYFVMFGGFEKPLKGLRIKRENFEEPIFHAQRFRERFLNKPMTEVVLSESGSDFVQKAICLSTIDAEDPR